MHAVALFLPDPTFTRHNVTAVLESVHVNWMVLANYLHSEQLVDVSYFSTPGERRKAVIDYHLATSPYVSWQRLAGVLCYREETRALEAMQKYIHGSAGLV